MNQFREILICCWEPNAHATTLLCHSGMHETQVNTKYQLHKSMSTEPNYWAAGEYRIGTNANLLINGKALNFIIFIIRNTVKDYCMFFLTNSIFIYKSHSV